jgi:hypothetical protein
MSWFGGLIEMLEAVPKRVPPAKSDRQQLHVFLVLN